MNYSLSAFLQSILPKDELTPEEYSALKASLLIDVDFFSLKDVYLKHNVLNTITFELLTKKTVDSQIQKILDFSIPLDEKSYPIVIFLILKNYRKFAGNLREFILKLNDKILKDIMLDPLFEGEYFVYLSRLMKNNLRFFRISVEMNRYNIQILDVFGESEEPEILFLLSNIKHIISKSESLLEKLLKNPFTPDESITLLKQIYLEYFEQKDVVESKDSNSESEEKQIQETKKEVAPPKEKIEKIISENIYQRILTMNIPDKIKLALRGNHTARMILVKDPNKQISLTVLKNPKMTEQEIDFILKNKSTAEHIVADIARTTQWTKNYNIIRDIVFHPKTPFEISVNFLGRLLANDLERLSKSRDVSSNLRNYSARMFNMKSKKK